MPDLTTEERIAHIQVQATEIAKRPDSKGAAWLATDAVPWLLERDGARTERDQPAAAIARARELHKVEDYLINPIVTTPTKHHGCFTCRTDGPCPTLLILEGKNE